MRLSTVFELLLIFLFLALASSRRIEKKHLKKGVTKQSFNSYCKCSDLHCNCCRDFPVVPIKGPGCAALGYQVGDTLRLTMSFGDRVLRNVSLVGKRPKPVCMGLPGGISRFCGRLYNIERLDDHFKACLALELRALDELEAALRVSCFNFGPKGVKLQPVEPFQSSSKPTDDYDDDDDYDIEDDDDDDDDEFDDDDDEYNDVESDGDYTGFTALSDQIFEGFFFPASESSGNKKKKPARPVQQDIVIDVTTKASPIQTYDSEEVSTTRSPVTTTTTTATTTVGISTTQRQVETTKSTPKVTVTTVSSTFDNTAASEGFSSPEVITDSSVNEPITTTEDKRENEEEDSESEDDIIEREKEEKEVEDDSDEGSAEEELHENENDEVEVSQVKLEDDDESDDEDVDSDEEDEQESDERNEEKDEDNDNILNSFFNNDDDSNERERERERERARMEKEKLERILPGLMALLKPSPTPPSEEPFAYPPVRSARVHRRMRLPPI